ncbi:MAG: N-6 DNA methylase [Candidatus Pacearchaeota archaeon]|nr:N-6 DNA methylase [Candidatus Pacearchaeota archaeon]
MCHKGIIKSNGEKISGKNLFNLLLKENNFFQALKYLFNKFNTPGGGKVRILKLGDYNLNIPYLNGGLFRPHDDLEKVLNITLKNKQWEEIFEFLNSYHWIIEDVKATEENEDKILTPEILGHVYERSVVEWESEGFEKEAEKAVKKITERKKKGVYYTPESITDYISNNTIIPYLLDKLGNKYASFDELVESKNKKDMKDALNVLDKIKVLDPACGSGAFLIKASEVIFGLKRRLNYEIKDKKNFYDLKLDIITENIYGVDILAGAIEISRLRLWLWLISDYDSKSEVEPLPNIEYNLMQGNSLIGFTSFKGKLLEVSKELKEKTKRFEELKSEYKTSHGKTSEIIRELLEKEMKSVRSELNSLYIKDLNSMGVGDFKVKKDIQFNFFGEKTKSKHDKFMYQDEFEKELMPFHWILEFSDTFKGNNSGFDVVIGNPPYATNYAKHSTKIKQEIINLLKSLYSFSKERTINRYNLIMFFLERIIQLSTPGSYLSMIIDGSGFYTTVYTEIRKELLKYNILELVDNLEAFQGVNTKQIIISFNKTDYIDSHSLIWKDGLDGKAEEIKQKEWKNSLDFNFSRPNKFEKIIKLIELNPSLEINFLPISGMNVTNRPESRLPPFLSDKRINSKYHKAIFSGNISPFFLEYPTKEQLNETSRKMPYICFDKSLGYSMNAYLSRIKEKARVSLGKTDDRYNQPKIFVRQSLSGKVCIEAAYSDDSDFYCDNSVYVINSKTKNKEELFYLLAVLNSKLITFYAKEKNILSKASSGSATRLPMGSNRGKGLKDFPIPYVSKEEQKPFVKLVNEIFSITKDKDYPENKEKQCKVKELQKKIDQFVYKLYKLTDEEIKIVENLF